MLFNRDKNKKNRVQALDFLRGLAIILMVADHIFFNLHEFYGIRIPYIYDSLNGNPIGMIYVSLETFFRLLFVVISGACCIFSKNNLLRGVKLLGIALIITLVTYLFSPDEVIIFGILHCLAVCMIIGHFINRLPFYVPASLGGCIILLGFSKVLESISPASNYLMILGITNENFFSADYFPLIPYLGWFFIGIALGKLLYGDDKRHDSKPHSSKKLPVFLSSIISVISFVGRYSLWMYILHQPVVLAVMYLIFGPFF